RLSTCSLRMISIAAPFTDSLSCASLVGHIRDQRNLPGPLDRRLQLALMHGAGAGDAPGQNLPALGNERAEQLHVLVVDIVDLVRAELADLAAAEQRTPLPLRLVAGLLVG